MTALIAPRDTGVKSFLQSLAFASVHIFWPNRTASAKDTATVCSLIPLLIRAQVEAELGEIDS